MEIDRRRRVIKTGEKIRCPKCGGTMLKKAGEGAKMFDVEGYICIYCFYFTRKKPEIKQTKLR